MKLYQTYASPFPTRVRLLIYAKGLDVEMIEPPGFHASVESKGDYLRINPIGRVPTLVLDDGRAIPESEVICEYLEDAFPEPSLRPADPLDRARMRLLSRICDFYVVMAMVPLFNLSARSRRHWEPAAVTAAADKVADALAYLETYIGEAGGNIVQLRMHQRQADFFDVDIDVDVNDAKHLTHIAAALRANPSVETVERRKD